MPDLDTTLESAAPADAGQPAVSQAVESSDSASSAAQEVSGEQPVASPDAAQPVAPPRLWAGKYKAPEDLEQGYAQSTQEAMRLFRENQALLQQVQGVNKPAAPAESYTPEQLQSYRDHWSREALKAQAAGDAVTAADCLGKVNQCHDKLVEARLSQERQRWQGESAVQRFQADASDVIKPYHQDLMNPVSPLNQAAQGYFMQAKQAIASGQSVDEVLSLLSSSLAVLKTGKASAGAESKARGEFSQSINQAMKQAVITGGGSASKPVNTTPDFDNMTSAQFRDYQRSLGVSA